jgi:hypothetical protein
MAVTKKMTTYEIVTKKIEANTKQYDRIKDTRKTINMDVKYEMRDYNNNKIEDCYPVTPNTAATFVDAIASDLIGAKWQVLLKGGITDAQSKVIQKLVESLLSQTDEMLRKSRRTPSLRDWIANHICHTGMIGARWVCDVDDKGNLIIDCLPVDMLHTPYEVGGREGLDGGWIAPVVFRPVADIIKDYPQVADRVGNKEDVLEVVSYHSAEKDELWIEKELVPRMYDGKMVKTIVHNRGYVPFAISGSSAGFMFRDKDSKKHEDEDILFLIRGLLKDLARMETIKLTVGMRVLRPSYEQEMKVITEGAGQKPPKDGEHLAVPEGGTHQIVNTGDLNQAAIESDKSINRMVGRGSVTPMNNERGGDTPPSALLVLEEAEMRSKRHTARVNGMQFFHEDFLRLMLKQVAELKADKIKIGRLGEQTEYSKIHHPDNYSIRARLMTKSKKLEYTNMTVAMTARGFLPDKFIYEHIAQLEDPDSVMEEMALQRMRMSNPLIEMHEQGISAIRKAEEIDQTDSKYADALRIRAMLLGNEVVTLMRARKQQLQIGAGQNGQGAKVPDKVLSPGIEEGKQNPGNVVGPMMNNQMSF